MPLFNGTLFQIDQKEMMRYAGLSPKVKEFPQDAIQNAYAKKGVPSCIVLDTSKGKGATFAEPKHDHSSQPSEEQWTEAIAAAEKALGHPYRGLHREVDDALGRGRLAELQGNPPGRFARRAAHPGEQVLQGDVLRRQR